LKEPASPNNHAGLIWAIADLLRGDYKQSEYGRVILPLVLLRRLDCVLEPTKAQVLARVKTLTVQTVGPVLKTVTGIEAYNTSRLNLRAILADPGQVAGNLRAWIAAFDADTRDVIEKFDFDAQIGRLDRAKLLYLVLSKVTEVDLHPDKVTNVEMGYLYEDDGDDERRKAHGWFGLRPNERPASTLTQLAILASRREKTSESQRRELRELVSQVWRGSETFRDGCRTQPFASARRLSPLIGGRFCIYVR